MAANKNLDPTTCTTASEAFKYPLPQVRQFHRSLTAELDEKNARLRTLVGGSYRDLLGTAEMILQMRQDIGIVEDKLGNVGKGCGRGVIAGMAGGLEKLQGRLKEGKSAEEMGWLAKMKVLGMCEVVVGRLLRRGTNTITETGQRTRGKNLVVAAKVLVLSRLLGKNLSDSATGRSKGDNELLEESRKKLKSLRKRLLRAIERTLEKTSGDENREDLVQALCAYSLASSSGAKDTLKHFLDVREEAITLSFDDDTDPKLQPTGVLKALELYTRTLLDVQALVPRRLSEALAGLKTKPLLKDEAIRELEGLRLDVCEKWFGDEILFFTPYIRHSDLEGAQAVEKLKDWAKKDSKIVLEGLAKTLQSIPEFKIVVELRTKILEVWIKEGGKARGFDPSVMLDGLRSKLNDHMVRLLGSRVNKLHLVGTEIEATLGDWRAGFTDKNQSLWDEEMLAMGISNGATHFKQGILGRTHGRNDAVSRAVKGYQTWRHLVDEVFNMLEQLKKQRWDNDLEDIEDDMGLESRNTLLSTEDPQMLQDHLNSSLEKAYSDLHQKISTLLAAYNDSEHIGQISIYILRILRDIRTDLPKNASLRAFGTSLLPPLHQRLASTMSAESVETISKSFNRKRVAGRALWEGQPELPVQPSPATFKFLHNLALAMDQAGADLWSPTAVGVLKRHLRSELGRHWNTVLKVHQDKEASEPNGLNTNGVATNGHVDSADATGEGQNGNSALVDPALVDLQIRKEVLIQSLFDIVFLQSALEISLTSEDEFQALSKTVESQVELEASARKRLQHAAKEYWKRTSLLFGLLA